MVMMVSTKSSTLAVVDLVAGHSGAVADVEASLEAIEAAAASGATTRAVTVAVAVEEAVHHVASAVKSHHPNGDTCQSP